MKSTSHPAVVALNLLLLWPLSFIALIFSGYVTASLWTWFVAPLGVRQIGVWHACGLLTFAGLVKLGLQRERYGDDAKSSSLVKSWTRLVYIVLGVLICWAFGAGYHALQGARP